MDAVLNTLGHRIGAVLGREECDLALLHVDVVDVFCASVRKDCCVLVDNGVIAAILAGSSAAKVRARTRMDCKGRTLLPGLMDAHVHIESTLMAPAAFAAAVVPCGTLGVFADPHEIANVAGAEGIRYMLDAARDQPLEIRFGLPSCVPCTPFEDAGAKLGAKDLAPFLYEERICALAEVMNCPGVLGGDPDLLAKISQAVACGLAVDGHSPGLAGASLQAYAASGVGSDHECGSAEEARERVEAGMYVFIREGSASRDLLRLLPAVTPESARRFCLCTDDLHAEDILGDGHINSILRKAVRHGLPAPLAVAMGSLNAAEYFHLRRVGAVAPGWRANLCLVDNLEHFGVERVWKDGVLVAEEGSLVVPTKAHPVPERIKHSVNVGAFSQESLRLALPAGMVRAICMQPHSLITDMEMLCVTTRDGLYDAEANPGLAKIAVIERHKATGLVGVAVLKNYVREGEHMGGAIATTVAHDSHNIVVAGDSDADMALAVRELCQMSGGIVVVGKGQVLSRLPLPVAGLMREGSPAEVGKLFKEVNQIARTLKIRDDVDAVMSLSFMSLCVIPHVKLNTRGLFDVDTFGFIPSFVDAKE